MTEVRPDILNHNTETVPRLFPTIRLGGDYGITIELLRRAKEWYPDSITKTGIMLGLGEEESELEEVIRDLVSVGVDILTLGQYLQPSRKHAPVSRFYHPDEFRAWKTKGEAMGIGHVEAGPLGHKHIPRRQPGSAPTGALNPCRTQLRLLSY